VDEFGAYLDRLSGAEAAAFRSVIATVREHVPEAEPGLAYGMPAFRYRGRPLLGFSSNQFGLNIYPFDPRIVAALASELSEYELGKGVVRFTVDEPISAEAIVLLLELRLAYLDGTPKSSGAIDRS
jgi:uncharacterized protein YdhG (YjbR/CyaY superfamily)